MGLFRQVRVKHSIHVDGPATIRVTAGRASVEIQADKAVKIEHRQPKTTKRGLTRRPKQA